MAPGQAALVFPSPFPSSLTLPPTLQGYWSLLSTQRTSGRAVEQQPYRMPLYSFWHCFPNNSLLEKEMENQAFGQNPWEAPNVSPTDFILLFWHVLSCALWVWDIDSMAPLPQKVNKKDQHASWHSMRQKLSQVFVWNSFRVKTAVITGHLIIMNKNNNQRLAWLVSWFRKRMPGVF